MPIPVQPVISDPDLPARADVVVIGGGIAGVTTALFLARKGISVALCEKGEIGTEQSGRNWGWCRTLGRDRAEIPLAMESLRLWRGMNSMIGGETGFRQAGIVYVYDTEAEVAAQEAWLALARLHQSDALVLRGAEMTALLPGMQRAFAGALYTGTDGRAEPFIAVPAMAEGARRLGVSIHTNCAVRGFEMQAGRVSAAVTERGTIACSSIVLAGGAWSRLFCGNLGIDLPQLKVMGSVMRTAKLEGAPEMAVGGSDFAFRKRLDGGYTIARRGLHEAPLVPDSFRLFFDFLPSLRGEHGGVKLRLNARFWEEWQTKRVWSLDEITPFETIRTYDPKPTRALLDEARATIAGAFPVFGGMQVEAAWAGLIDTTPDQVPVIGEVPYYPGFFISTGYSGHGFGIGPGAGRLTADIVAGDTPVVDPTPFRLSRFKRLAAIR
ncbi:MAG: FAD-binding oxidoreductase [Acetobacteraceae bacterium]|nr:FAD-binding oxidoreductase [Acetobacteraceae bacterium]MSP28910.1 FAD-binding oxidoreductase [Acetobacteraceae bacterium]